MLFWWIIFCLIILFRTKKRLTCQKQTRIIYLVKFGKKSSFFELRSEECVNKMILIMFKETIGRICKVFFSVYPKLVKMMLKFKKKQMQKQYFLRWNYSETFFSNILSDPSARCITLQTRKYESLASVYSCLINKYI